MKDNMYENIENEVFNFINSASNRLIKVPTNVYLLPFVTKDLTFVEKMNGVVAHTDGNNTIYIYLNVKRRVSMDNIKSICFHEYQHVVRNSIVESKESKTLLDVIIDEGCSEVFVEYALGKEYVGKWATVLSKNEINKYLEMFKHKLELTEPYEIQKFMLGNSSEYPLWLGYSMGYHLVYNYKNNEFVKDFESLIRINPYQVYLKSGFIINQ
ncbi:DUF2268 domain-containing putative Zn-dependent protease [Lysinibacillus sp. NPDC092081]|uniref:DUF2268 domain-containing putative Zn-dependent protease n=1 Tax=Lysinibacillus sp. NPDC092081 TaxID=3364131 RepID=UPI003808E1C4